MVAPVVCQATRTDAVIGARSVRARVVLLLLDLVIVAHSSVRSLLWCTMSRCSNLTPHDSNLAATSGVVYPMFSASPNVARLILGDRGVAAVGAVFAYLAGGLCKNA